MKRITLDEIFQRKEVERYNNAMETLADLIARIEQLKVESTDKLQQIDKSLDEVSSVEGETTENIVKMVAKYQRIYPRWD